MPRNVVTVLRRRLLGRRSRRERQDAVLAELGERFRVRWRDRDGVEIDVPQSLGRRRAKDRVVADLDEIASDWAKLVRVYPSENSLRAQQSTKREP